MVDCFYSLCGNYRDYCSPFALHGSGRTDFLYAEAVRNHGIGYDCPDVVGTSAAFSHRTGFGVTDRDSFDGFDRGRRYLYFADDRRWNTHFAGLLSRLQAVFTPRIIVVILCLIAFTLSPVILRLIFAGNSFVLFHLFFALLLALAMILANKLLKGIWKSIVVLGGILVGSMVYYSVMGFPETGGIQAGHEGYFGLWPWKFDLGAVLSFFFCFIALIVNELGSIQAVGRMIGADHMERRTTRGVGITGLANVVSGALGIVGPVDYSMSPGIIAATGCASRFPLIPAGIGLVVCAFFPGFIECLNAIPGVVMGAVLLYLMASQLSAGMQMMIREKAVDGFDGGIVVGFSLMVALLLSFAPDEALNSIPALIRPIVGNGFVMGVITVLILEHLIFRAGKKAKKE